MEHKKLQESELEEDEEKERSDVVQRMDDKARRSLKYKRSFFVRMVSDPKIYNPKIVLVDDETTADGKKEADSEDGGLDASFGEETHAVSRAVARNVSRNV